MPYVNTSILTKAVIIAKTSAQARSGKFLGIINGMDKILTAQEQDPTAIEKIPASSMKRRHHYVWRYYLKAWSTNEKIWCRQDGKFFNPNLINIAQSRDFYKLEYLSDEDIKNIRELAIIEETPPHLKKMSEKWVSLLNFPFQLKRHLEGRGVNWNAELDKSLNNAFHDIQENIHERIERNAIRDMNSIRDDENINFYKTKAGRANFLHFLCVQYMRTNRMKSAVIARKFQGVDLEKIWNVLALIFATNMGWSCYTEGDSFRMFLLKNNSQKELIAGDQPVINTCAVGLSKTEAPEEVEFYYPMSPRLAVLITKNFPNNPSDQIILTGDDVAKYNSMMIEESHSQIYAASKETLMAHENK